MYRNDPLSRWPIKTVAFTFSESKAARDRNELKLCWRGSRAGTPAYAYEQHSWYMSPPPCHNRMKSQVSVAFITNGLWLGWLETCHIASSIAALTTARRSFWARVVSFTKRRAVCVSRHWRFCRCLNMSVFCRASWLFITVFTVWGRWASQVTGEKYICHVLAEIFMRRYQIHGDKKQTNSHIPVENVWVFQSFRILRSYFV